MKVSAIMTPNVQLVSPDQPIQEAANLMEELDAGSLPVSDGERLVGYITDRDIALRAVGRGLGPETKVKAVMSQGVKYCFEDDDVASVAKNMAENQIEDCLSLVAQSASLASWPLATLPPRPAGTKHQPRWRESRKPVECTNNRWRKCYRPGSFVSAAVEASADSPARHRPMRDAAASRQAVRSAGSEHAGGGHRWKRHCPTG